MLTFIWIVKIQAGVILDILHLLFAILYLNSKDFWVFQNLKYAIGNMKYPISTALAFHYAFLYFDKALLKL